jgi:hypothetical protein
MNLFLCRPILNYTSYCRDENFTIKNFTANTYIVCTFTTCTNTLYIEGHTIKPGIVKVMLKAKIVPILFSQIHQNYAKYTYETFTVDGITTVYQIESIT